MITFKEDRIKELQDKGFIYEGHNDLENYKILEDVIHIDNLCLLVSLFKNGDINIKYIFSPSDLNACIRNNRLVGIGARKYRGEILSAVSQFKEQYKDILNYLEGGSTDELQVG